LTLKKRIIIASSWVVGGHAMSQIIRLTGNLIMTRLLVPDVFGIMAIAHVIIMGLALFSDFGLQQNIIQNRRGDQPNFLNTAWVLQIARGALVAICTLLLALLLLLLQKEQWTPVQTVYSDPLLPGVIAVLSISALLSGFNSTKLAMSNRNLVMHLIVRIELLSQISGLLFIIGWALIDRTIWALVLGAVFVSLVKMVLSHSLLPGEPNRFQWDKECFWEIFHFGKWVFITSILGYAAGAADTLLLGGMIDSATMGLYVIASLLVNAFWQIFQQIIGRVAFPALSEVARLRSYDLKKTYYKFRLPVDIVSLFLAGLLFSSGEVFVRLLYDDRYLAAGHMFEVLSIVLFSVRFTLANQCFVALGMPRLLIPNDIVRLFVLIIFIPMAFNSFGLNGVLWIAGGSTFFSIPILFYFKKTHGLLDWKKELLVLPMLPLGYVIGVFAKILIGSLGFVI